MVCLVPGRSVFVFAVIAAGSGGTVDLDWQEKYWAGMRGLQEGRYVDARAALQSAYDAAQQLPASDPWKARAAFGLGSFALSRGNIAWAERLHNDARIMLEGQGEASPLLAMVWNGLGEIFMEQSRLEEAEDVIGKALSVFGRDPKLSGCAFLSRRRLAEIRVMRQDYAGAEQMLQALLADERQAPAASDVELPATLRIMGHLYIMQNRLAEAEPLLREAMTLQLARNQNLAAADTMVTLSGLYRLEGRLERAAPLLRKAVKCYEQAGDPHAVSAYVELARCAAAEKKYLTARNLLQKAIDMARKGPMSDVLIARFEQDLASIMPEFASK